MSQDPSQTEKTSENELKDDQVDVQEPVEAAESDAGDEQSKDDLLEQIAALKDEVASAQEQVLRASAEVQNARRRAEQDVEKAHKFALDKFVNDMLPVADNLERALEASSQNQEAIAPLIEGVELTLKTLIDGLKRHKVEPINPVGEPFDPQVHQAMSMVPDPNSEPNTVLNVFQKGYTLNERLVRPAMVVVSKADA